MTRPKTLASLGSTAVLAAPEFEQEECHCGRPGELAETNMGGYLWRCRKCGVSWVTEGSVMDVANDLAYTAANSGLDTVGH